MLYIKFSNQTYGEKARTVLRANGIASQLKRNPNPNHREGCNFALYVNGDIYKAASIIENAYIPFLGIESYRDKR